MACCFANKILHKKKLRAEIRHFSVFVPNETIRARALIFFYPRRAVRIIKRIILILSGVTAAMPHEICTDPPSAED